MGETSILVKYQICGHLFINCQEIIFKSENSILYIFRYFYKDFKCVLVYTLFIGIIDGYRHKLHIRHNRAAAKNEIVVLCSKNR